ncbi:MAG: cyclic nucleotide-binding domain-containing protein [Anaeromyxobacteraceae bacterium]
MDAVKQLKATYLFKDLPDTALKRIAQAAESVTAQPGEAVVQENRASDALFVIRSGSCKVHKEKAGGAHDVVVLGPGSHFGEAALLDDAPRSATVTASERTDLLVLRAGKLRAVLDGDHEAGHHVYRALATSLARRLRQTTDDLAFARALVSERR